MARALTRFPLRFALGILGQSLVLILNACTGFVTDIPGRATSTTSSSSSSSEAPSALSVGSEYSNATNWMDWAKSDDSSACVGNEALITDCVHGGDKRLVITPYTSCAGLSMTDNLAAFDWTCSVVSGTARFTSALKSAKRLGDLVSTSDWNDNYVTLSGGAQGTHQSPAAKWWTNTVTALPTDAGAGAVISLASSGTVYVMAANANSAPFSIDADKIAVVIKSGATLTITDRQTVSTPEGTLVAALSANIRKHIWIEGAVTGAARIELGLSTNQVSFSHLRHITVTNIRGADGTPGSTNGFTDDGFTCTDYTGTNTDYGRVGGGILFYDSDKNYVSDISITGVYGGAGVTGIPQSEAQCPSDGFFHTFAQINSGDAGSARGFFGNFSDGNVMSGISISQIQAGTSAGDILLQFTGNAGCNYNILNPTTQPGSYGLMLGNSHNNTLSNISINNVSGPAAVDLHYAMAMAAPNANYGVYFTGNSNTFNSLSVSNIAGTHGNNAGSALSNPCAPADYNNSPQAGGEADGIMVGGASNVLNTVSSTAISGGNAGTMNTGSHSVIGGTTASAVGGTAYAFFQWIGGVTIDSISIDTVSAGANTSGWDPVTGAYENAMDAASAYGIWASANLTISSQALIDNITAAIGTPSQSAGGNGGSAYGIYMQGAANLIADDIMANLTAGMAGDSTGGGTGGNGGNAYTINDSTTGTLSYGAITGTLNAGGGGNGAIGGNSGTSSPLGP